MKYYVYELIDPRDSTVFYVGKGCGGRIDNHEVEARKGRVSRKCDRIREIEAQGYSIVKRKVSHFHQELDAYLFEEDHIASYGLHMLTNVQPGGGTVRGQPTMAGDRTSVRVAAGMIARCGFGKIAAIVIDGSRLDLLAIIEDFKRAVAVIMDRRGHDWVNEIAKKWRVEFVLVPPV